MPTPETHAMLSASSAEKWLHCTPSAFLEAQQPDETSEYAKEGTLAHAICELYVRNALVEPMVKRTFNSKLKAFQKDELYNEEMLKCAGDYLEYIQSVYMSYKHAPYITLEQKVDYSEYAPGGFGTCDCIIIGGKELNIIDYKHGKGVKVDADSNPQLMLYALGALTKYWMLYAIETVKISIVQPRLNNVSTYKMYAEDLEAWGCDIVIPAALLANKGEGPFNPGPWCDNHFCKLRDRCQARADRYLSLEDEFKFRVPPIISNDEVGIILERAYGLQKWIKQLEGFALNEILAGRDVAGYKAVEGISRRAFDDTDTVMKSLIKYGIEPALLYKQVPATLTEVEKLLGKKTFDELLSEHIVKPHGAPTLVPKTDKREPYQPTTAEEEFKNIEKE